jgi:hypothetical protein
LNPAGGAQLDVRDAPLGADDASEVLRPGAADDAAGAAAALPCSTRRRSPPPSRMVIASGSIAVSVTPGAICSPCATSLAPAGKRNNAYPRCGVRATMPTSRASPGSTDESGASTGACAPAPLKRSAATIVAAGSAGGGAAMCNDAGAKICQPQYATTSASAQPAMKVANADANRALFIANRRTPCRRYNRARLRPDVAPA